MEKISALSIIIAISVFLISLFIYWRVMSYYSKRELGNKMHKQWNSRLYFWQGAIFTSTGITFLVMFVLKWANILHI